MASGTFDGYIDGMTDTTGQPIGRINYGITEGTPNRFAGKPVVEVEDDVIKNYDDAAVGDVVAILTDLKNYGLNSNLSMINQVAIYNKDDKLIKTLKNAEAIKLYGVMQDYLKQPEKEDVTAQAKKLIDDNGEVQKITLNNLGNIANVTGGTVVVREPYTGLYGLFFIDSDVHTWKNGIYLNKLVVNFKNMMDEKEVGSLPNKSGDKTTNSTIINLR